MRPKTSNLIVYWFVITLWFQLIILSAAHGEESSDIDFTFHWEFDERSDLEQVEIPLNPLHGQHLIVIPSIVIFNFVNKKIKTC